MYINALASVTKKYEAMTNEERLSKVSLEREQNPLEDFYTIFDDIVVITIANDGSIVDTCYETNDR